MTNISNPFRVAVVQAASVAFDRDRTLEKVAALANEAARQGARLVLFPEAFVSAYPRGLDFGAVVGNRTEEGRRDFQRYWESSLDVPGPAVDALARTARANQYRPLHVVNQSVRHWFGTDPSANPCSGPDSQNASSGFPNNNGGVCAYGSDSAGQFGSARVNNGPRAPGYRIVDLSLFKSFPTYEAQALTFRVDAFNVGNIASYAAPAYVSAANGVSPATWAAGGSVEGQITSTLSPARQLQLSLIYRF